MPDLAEYLGTEFLSIEKQLRSINDSLTQILSLLHEAFDVEKGYWHYEYGSESEYSDSTQAMCALAVHRLVFAELETNGGSKQTERIQRELTQILHNSMRVLRNKVELDRTKEGKLTPHWKSETFGENDPFVGHFLFALFSRLEDTEPLDIMEVLGSGKSEEESTNALRASKEETKSILNVIVETMKRTVQENQDYGSAKSDKASNAILHPMIMSRFASTHLEAGNRGLRDKDLDASEMENITKWLHRYFKDALQEELYYHQIRDPRFDVATLIFSLDGAITSGALRFPHPTIDAVLDVIIETQYANVNWSASRPFKSTPRGGASFPLSIEVANALLHIAISTKTFDKLLLSFQRYHEWLEKNKIDDPDKGHLLQGWHSEHTYGRSERIQTWVSSQVAIFLLDYRKELHCYLEKQLLRHCGLAVKSWEDVRISFDPGGEEGTVGTIEDPERGSARTTLDRFKQEFITPNQNRTRIRERKLRPKGYRSLILYGPPGTSKTTYAQAMARTLRMNLVTVTVPDFLEKGELMVESRAKEIFEVLLELDDHVILFDEIEELILDRESGFRENEDSVIKLMTPSMLAKLNDLREVARSIFIIATNYLERIDPAISRKGRIDERLLIVPPNQEAREKLIRRFLGIRVEEENRKLPEGRLESIAKRVSMRTALFTYRELESLSRMVPLDSSDPIQSKEDQWKQFTPLINLDNYTKRLIDANTRNREPLLEEFLGLCLIHLEAVEGPEAEKKPDPIYKVINKLTLTDKEKELIKRKLARTRE